MTRHARIELVPVDGYPAEHWAPHYLRLRASNSLTLAHSETYSSKSKARRGVKAWLDAMTQVVFGQDAEGFVVEVES